MPSTRSYSEVDDGSLVEGVLAGSDLAFGRLLERYDRFSASVILRVLDERRPNGIAELPTVEGAFQHELRRDGAAVLSAWGGASTLRGYLGVLARQVAESHVQDATPTALDGRQAFSTPAALFLDDLVAAEPAKRLTDALDRLSPHISALVRLRLRGLDRNAIASSLGMPQQAVVSNLERLATRLGELNARELNTGELDASEQSSGDRGQANAAWRSILDCASTAERVRTALLRQDDPVFRKSRDLAELTWRSVRERALTWVLTRSMECLSDIQVASFVDGSMPGVERAKLSVHVTTCGRCTDRVAGLTQDLRVVGALRDSATMPRVLALSATCIATGRFRAGVYLADAAGGTSDGALLARAADIGIALEDSRRLPRGPGMSGIQSRRIPEGREAALAATEALMQEDGPKALRLLEGRDSKDAVGIRLRLLANAFGNDPKLAGELARELLDRPHRDPGVVTDAEGVAALPEGRALPREILHERLRTLLPELARLVVTERGA